VVLFVGLRHMLAIWTGYVQLISSAAPLSRPIFICCAQRAARIFRVTAAALLRNALRRNKQHSA